MESMNLLVRGIRKSDFRVVLDSTAGTENDSEIASLVEVKKNLTRRAIEQMGFIRDINSLVVLSGTRPEVYYRF